MIFKRFLFRLNWHINWLGEINSKSFDMKTNLFFYAMLLFLPLGVFGHYDNAHLEIEFENYNSYFVQIGNEEFSTNGTSISIENLNRGFYPVRIYEFRHRKKYLIYSGGVNLAEASWTYSIFYRGNLIVTEVIPFLPTVYVMNDAEFNRFLFSVREENFDSSRLEMMEMQLNYQFFTSFQIAQIMDEFSFESNKLDFAKMAFGRTVDPENYYRVSEKFTFSSSKKELKEYIMSH